MGRDIEEAALVIIEILSHHLRGYAEENRENCKSLEAVLWPRVDSSTSRIHQLALFTVTGKA